MYDLKQYLHDLPGFGYLGGNITTSGLLVGLVHSIDARLYFILADLILDFFI